MVAFVHGRMSVKARRFEFSDESRRKLNFICQLTPARWNWKVYRWMQIIFYYSNETDTRERNFKGIFWIFIESERFSVPFFTFLLFICLAVTVTSAGTKSSGREVFPSFSSRFAPLMNKLKWLSFLICIIQKLFARLIPLEAKSSGVCWKIVTAALQALLICPHHALEMNFNKKWKKFLSVYLRFIKDDKASATSSGGLRTGNWLWSFRSVLESFMNKSIKFALEHDSRFHCVRGFH